MSHDLHELQCSALHSWATDWPVLFPLQAFLKKLFISELVISLFMLIALLRILSAGDFMTSSVLPMRTCIACDTPCRAYLRSSLGFSPADFGQKERGGMINDNNTEVINLTFRTSLLPLGGITTFPTLILALLTLARRRLVPEIGKQALR